MKIDFSFICKCGAVINATVPCPEPNYMAERNRDSYVETDDEVVCDECGENYEVSIINSFGGADVSPGESQEHSGNSVRAAPVSGA